MYAMAYNDFFEKMLSIGSFMNDLTILRRVSFFTPYSVDAGDFLPHTQ
jgi:hypothetical protein